MLSAEQTVTTDLQPVSAPGRPCIALWPRLEILGSNLSVGGTFFASAERTWMNFSLVTTRWHNGTALRATALPFPRATQKHYCRWRMLLQSCVASNLKVLAAIPPRR